MTTVAIGTPGYMPAEQRDCRPRFSSDIYAVGIICFRALTGLEPQKLPRDFNTDELCCDLFSECTQINAGFKKVLDTMVRFDYRQRYLDATVALQALQPLLNIYQASTTIQTPPTSISPQSQTSPTLISTTAESPTVLPSMPTPTNSPPIQLSLLGRILQALQQLFGFGETNNSPPSATVPQPTPLTQSWEQPEGHVSLDSGFYVERPPIESDCYETILQPGALIRIKAPRQMGKTSLLTRVLHHAEERGCKTFALLGVATPSDLIQDRRRTPFNIGRAIELTGFDLESAKPLAQGLAVKSSNPKAVLQAVLDWTGGHPFLSQKVCKLIQNVDELIPEDRVAQWVEQLVQTLVISNWEAQDEPEHLKTIRDRIFRSGGQRTGRLLGLYQQVLQFGAIAADGSIEQIELRLSGLVVRHEGKLKVYNRIYAAVFNQSWLEKALASLRPYAETLRAWVDSGYQDESRLLRGQALQKP